MAAEEEAEERELVVEAATRLFVQLGYDGTTLQMIGEVAGTSAQQVSRLAGEKQHLYLEVMTRYYEAEAAHLRGVMERVVPDRAGLHSLVDGYLDFSVAHPELRSLWVHRWLGDAADVQDVEALYRPMIAALVEMFRAAVRADCDLELALWNIIWIVNGFIHVGIVDAEGTRRLADHPPTIRRFRTYMHDMLDRTAF
ncbi:TetR/AcrR family transcriptional regulator [Actinomadura sp. WMMA1423]|uniref:TetR/AcrR family transcriptional regulator n=1 Tax=Actinomadura sp. WMMA1423 TaxID=2591108 RepID=UPI00143CECF8|nr:TetR/AcrR family transcriptional regulator [Actinomadura sp. WMMA1423]